jgi:predicted TIM-barrel enzyme
MAGRGSTAGLLAYGDANAIVVDMAREILPIVQHTPVLAGVNGTDPFRMMRTFLPRLREMGFDGVQNFQTVGLFDGHFRQVIEETGMSYDLEVEMIDKAHQLEMLTCPYVFNEEEAVKMTQAGADVLVPHLHATVKGSSGVQSALSLDEAADRVQAMHDAAKKINPDVVVLCHGGPIAEPEDVQHVLDNTSGTVAPVSVDRSRRAWRRVQQLIQHLRTYRLLDRVRSLWRLMPRQPRRGT